MDGVATPRDLGRKRRRPMRSVHTAATLHDTPTPRARWVGRGARLTVKPLLSLAPVDVRTINRLHRWAGRTARAASADIAAVEAVVGGVPGEIMTPACGPPAR